LGPNETRKPKQVMQCSFVMTKACYVVTNVLLLLRVMQKASAHLHRKLLQSQKDCTKVNPNPNPYPNPNLNPNPKPKS
jgi:hypothetical protein